MRWIRCVCHAQFPKPEGLRQGRLPAGDADHKDAADRFAAEVAERWDSEALRRDVIFTQKQRRAVYAAMEAGAIAHWDYNPPRNASQEYVRNHMDWTEAAARMRFPPLKG